jgi:hypothetical protein
MWPRFFHDLIDDAVTPAIRAASFVLTSVFRSVMTGCNVPPQCESPHKFFVEALAFGQFFSAGRSVALQRSSVKFLPVVVHPCRLFLAARQ